MAYKLRITEVNAHDYTADDPQVNVQIEAFDDASLTTVAKGNLAYSGKALAGMTAADVRARIREDALLWADSVKSAAVSSPDVSKNISTISRISTLIGQAIDIP